MSALPEKSNYYSIQGRKFSFRDPRGIKAGELESVLRTMRMPTEKSIVLGFVAERGWLRGAVFFRDLAGWKRWSRGRPGYFFAYVSLFS